MLYFYYYRLSPEIIELIKEKLDENCAITSGDLVIYVREEFDINVCLSTIDRAIGSFHYSVKRITHRALAGDTPQNVQARIDFMAIECMFAEWKTYVKRGLANTRALTKNKFICSFTASCNELCFTCRT